jgi:hypothetical protein
MMTTESLPQESVDAPKPVVPAEPAGPPAGYLSGLDISDEMIDNASWREKDKLIVARATAREAQRIAAEKVKAESDASSKRAKAAVDALVAKDKATPEDQKPTTDPAAKGYNLDIPEVGADKQQQLDDTVHDLGLLGAEAGIDQEQLQTLVNVATDFALAEPEGLDYSNQEECENILRGEWGADFDARVALVQRQVKLWGPSVAEYLSGTGIGNSPGVVKAIYQFASGNAHMTKAQAEAEIAKINGDQKHGYWKGEKNATAKMRTLREIASRGEATGPTRTVAAVATTPGIEAEIAAIRANPDYTSLDSRKRKPLVERMSALQAAIHG